MYERMWRECRKGLAEFDGWILVWCGRGVGLGANGLPQWLFVSC